MTVSRIRWMAVLFFLTLLATTREAQTTILNIPSADTMPRIQFYVEADLISHATPFKEGGFPWYGPSVIYGLGKNIEVGINAYSIKDGDSANVKSKFFEHEDTALARLALFIVNARIESPASPIAVSRPILKGEPAMNSLSDRVAIVGMGCTKFGEHWDKSEDDLIVEAAYEAFEDAGVEPGQIEAAWVGTLVSGISGQALSRPLKLQYIPITRVENMCATGQDALRNAAYSVMAGAYDLVLVVGFEKLKDSGYSGLPGAASSVIGAGNTAPGAFALAANRYFHKYGTGKEELAKISVKNHYNGARNKKAHFQKEITLEQAMKAPMIASPLGLLDCCPTTDGAAAAIITRTELAPKFNKDFVTIKAMGLSVGPGTGRMDPDFDFTSFPETKMAAKQIYDQLGIKDPRKEVSMAEVHDCFSITEMIIYEDLGFSEPGKAKLDIDSGAFTLKGDLPVNTDGGLKSFGHPIGASGLRMLYEIYTQLQGRAGERQVKDMKLGLAHNLGGNPGSFTCSIIALGHA